MRRRLKITGLTKGMKVKVIKQLTVKDEIYLYKILTIKKKHSGYNYLYLVKENDYFFSIHQLQVII